MKPLEIYYLIRKQSKKQKESESQLCETFRKSRDEAKRAATARNKKLKELESAKQKVEKLEGEAEKYKEKEEEAAALAIEARAQYMVQFPEEGEQGNDNSECLKVTRKKNRKEMSLTRKIQTRASNRSSQDLGLLCSGQWHSCGV